MKKFLLLFLVFTLSALSVQGQRSNIDAFNVFDFGAAGDGSTDDTQAFKDAWKATCSSEAASPTMHIPYGFTFFLQPVVFRGPCKPNNTINVAIDGNLTAPSDPSKWKCDGQKCHQWIAFLHLDGLNISGSGIINGQGSEWWGSYCKHKKDGCGRKPTGFVIARSNNVRLSDLTFMDSPQMHIAFEKSTWVYATDLTITAPWHSPNTDGIHVQNSQNVFISQSHIGTGDDCISIGDGSSHLNITGITCGPGHGISIGSLGIRGSYETVENVHVSDVDFRGTSNGARIKTWQGGSGFARNIVFERIRSHGATHPIIIDQFYCDHTHCKNQTSAVHVSNVTYSQIEGTLREETAVKFACSESVPCTNIVMEDINLRSTQHRSETKSLCSNVEGRRNDAVFPRVPCLTSLIILHKK